jgi:biotin carboxyl carrier protein
VDGAGTPRAVVAIEGLFLPVEVGVGLPPAGPPGAASGPQAVRAPMAGRVAKLLLRTGDQVVLGASVVVLEAMKMENEIRAPRAGRIEEIRVEEGSNVTRDQTLFVVA